MESTRKMEEYDGETQGAIRTLVVQSTDHIGLWILLVRYPRFMELWFSWFGIGFHRALDVIVHTCILCMLSLSLFFDP